MVPTSGHHESRRTISSNQFSYLADSHRHSQNGIGSEPALVLCAIEVPHPLVYTTLVQGAQTDEGRGNLPQDVVHDLEDTLTYRQDYCG